MTAPGSGARHPNEAVLRRRSLLTAVATGLGALLVFFALGLSALKIRRNDAVIKQQLDSIDRNEARIRPLLDSVRRYEAQVKSLVPSALVGFGWRTDSVTHALVSDTILVHEALDANDELAALLARPTSKRPTTVLYFGRDTLTDVNKRLFVQSMTRMGFTVKILDPHNPCPSNAIDFGREVPISEVRLAAYSMIRAGMRVRTINRFALGNTSHLIQIGSTWAVRKAPPLTVAIVRAARDFPIDTIKRTAFDAAQLDSLYRECGRTW